MEYLGEEIPKLGFGLMRLPEREGTIDIHAVSDMVDRFLAAGFTYFDTAYVYNAGESERAIKAALVDRYPRERFQLATKLPAWSDTKSAEEARQMFFTSLERTGAGYFDFYLLHNVTRAHKETFDKFDLWTFLQEQKARGLIRHLGFSMHDSPEFLDGVLNEHPEMEFVQLQINYADWENERVQSRRNYETARRHGKPVIIMEPVKGGALSNLPEETAAELRTLRPDASLSSWAIRFAASLPGVITVLSGMSDRAQMDDNLKTMSAFEPLSDSEQEALVRVREKLRSQPTVPCTGCRYCVDGCPAGVDIPMAFRAMNDRLVYGSHPGALRRYAQLEKRNAQASRCIACGHCESVCPQKIEIIDALKKAAELFETNP